MGSRRDNEKQKRIWKEESEQLKKDLNSRPKEYKKNEVQLRLGKQNNTQNSSPSKKTPPKSTQEDDLAMRRFLGI